jgi:hypothetical protein
MTAAHATAQKRKPNFSELCSLYHIGEISYAKAAAQQALMAKEPELRELVGHKGVMQFVIDMTNKLEDGWGDIESVEVQGSPPPAIVQRLEYRRASEGNEGPIVDDSLFSPEGVFEPLLESLSGPNKTMYLHYAAQYLMQPKHQPEMGYESDHGSDSSDSLSADDDELDEIESRTMRKKDEAQTHRETCSTASRECSNTERTALDLCSQHGQPGMAPRRTHHPEGLWHHDSRRKHVMKSREEAIPLSPESVGPEEREQIHSLWTIR